MKFTGKIENGVLIIDTPRNFKKETVKLEGKKVEIEVKKFRHRRTESQNNALHLWFTQLAEELNDKHFSVKAILKEGVEVDWSPVLVKEIMFKPLQKAIYGKGSTTELDKLEEIDKITDTINRLIVERTKGECSYVPFPCLEGLY